MQENEQGHWAGMEMLTWGTGYDKVIQLTSGQPMFSRMSRKLIDLRLGERQEQTGVMRKRGRGEKFFLYG